MTLNGGTFQGKRLLSAASVKVMTSVHTGSTRAGNSTGTGFGLAWEVTAETQGTLPLQSIGSYGHGGAFGTYAG